MKKVRLGKLKGGGGGGINKSVRSGADEVYILLGKDAVSLGSWFPATRGLLLYNSWFARL